MRDLANEAVNAAASLIQDRLGVTDGGFAALCFSDNKVRDWLVEYIRSEIHL